MGAMNGGSATPSPKSLPNPLIVGGVSAFGGAAGTGFSFTSPAIPGPLPQLSPPQPQLLGPSVYTPHLTPHLPQHLSQQQQSRIQQNQQQTQPQLKRQRYDVDAYEEGEEEGDVSGEIDHDFDFSMMGGQQQQYGGMNGGGMNAQNAGAGEQQGQEDQKRP